MIYISGPLFESSKRDLLSTLCVLLYCRPRVHIAVVSCLNRVEETLVMLKSALLQTKAKLKFHVFADDENMPKFKSEVSGKINANSTP